MMTDAQLDAQLDALAAIEPDETVQFESVENFKTRFFAKVQTLQKAEEKKDTIPDTPSDSIWTRMLNRLTGTMPRAGDRTRAAALGKRMARRNMIMESLAEPACLFSKMSFGREAECCIAPMGAGAIADAWAPMGDVRSGLPEDFNTEEYSSVTETPFVASARNPLSTFGADVDTAGYTNARRMIMENDCLPPTDSIRLDEFLNYFRYSYPQPAEGTKLRPHFEFADAPWAMDHKLLLVGIQARDIDKSKLPPSNYVFLIDNSGSMDHVFKIVKEALRTLTNQLRPQDKVSIVTYGGGVSTLLEGCGDRNAILNAINALNCEGYTPGGEAIQKAYALAHTYFIKGGNNRIVLITDGDFNVGASSEADLTAMVEKERGNGIYLSVVGAGSGNYKDNRMKALANKGDGNYIYIDTVAEARRAFTEGLTGQMYTLAHDVKFQLEFNPARVYAYRLLGYEMRRMADTDFRDDKKDSGEIGVGQQVTALYEIIPMDAPADVKAAAVPEAPPLRYSSIAATGSDELLTFHLRYQKPEGGDAVEEEFPVANAENGANLGWASAVAEFALLLRNSKYKGTASYEEVIRLAKGTLGPDTDTERLEFIGMVTRAKGLAQLTRAN